MDQSAVQKIFKKLVQRPENSICADCGDPAPTWASIKLGIFICLRCSGIHRSLGTHISFVRSLTLDSWRPEQVQAMIDMGNAKANTIWEAELPKGFVRPTDTRSVEAFINDKYVKNRYAARSEPSKASKTPRQARPEAATATKTQHRPTSAPPSKPQPVVAAPAETQVKSERRSKAPSVRHKIKHPASESIETQAPLFDEPTERAPAGTLPPNNASAQTNRSVFESISQPPPAQPAPTDITSLFSDLFAAVPAQPQAAPQQHEYLYQPNPPQQQVVQPQQITAAEPTPDERIRNIMSLFDQQHFVRTPAAPTSLYYGR